MTRSYLMCGALLVAACNGSGSSHKDEAGSAAPVSAAKLGEATSNPFKTTDDVIAGRKIFLKYGCSGCHGMGGGGGMGKPLIDDEWKFGSDDRTLYKLIRGEIPEQTMPATFGKVMTEEETWKVLLYVRSIYAGDTAKINWTVPPPVTPEMYAAANKETGDPIAAGKEIFMQICTPCHGTEGRGDGPAAVTLDPKPRNLTDAAYMSGLNERYMFELISRGGVAVGKSPLMPAQAGLAAQDIDHVIAYVKTLSAAAK